MLASTRCSPTTKKQWSSAIASAVGVTLRPAYASSIQYPTWAVRADPQTMLPTVSCPANWPP